MVASVPDAHVKLMAGYARALGQAEQAGRIERLVPLVKRWVVVRWAIGDRMSPLVAPLIRLLVGAHVRRRLSRIAGRYAQLEMATEADEGREWLARAREDAERVAEGLPSLRLPGIAALVSVLVGIATLVTKLSVPEISTAAWGVAVFILLELLIFNYDALPHAYRYKRELLLPGATGIDRTAAPEQGEHTDGNVYADEDALFAALASAKNRESPLDVRSYQFVVVVVGLLLAVPVGFVDDPGLVGELWIAAAVTFVIFGCILLDVRLQRQWR